MKGAFMKQRNIGICILLSIVTLGIYGIYWFICVTDDVVRLSKGKVYNTTGGTAFLLTLVTCGIYGYYWAYQMGKSMYIVEREKDDYASDNSVLYLVLEFIGLGIVSTALIQNSINKQIENVEI